MVKKKRKSRWEPIRCVVLAVDTARNSGVALFSRGVLHDSGEVDIFDARSLEWWCRQALEHKDEYALKHDPRRAVLVLERPWGGSFMTVEGLGAARHAWVSAWLSAGGAKKRVVRVYPQTWRGALGIRGPRDEAGFACATRGALVRPDEAAAICIGSWGCRAPEVFDVLPKERTK